MKDNNLKAHSHTSGIIKPYKQRYCQGTILHDHIRVYRHFFSSTHII